MSKRILIFSTAYEPLIGGAELAVRNITDRLSSYDFDLITLRFEKRHQVEEKIGNVTVRRIGSAGRFGKFLFPLQAVIRAWRFTPDLIWGMDISQGSVAAALYRLVRPRVPFVLTVQYGYGADRLKRGRLGMINLSFRFMLAEADMVTVISRDLEKLVRAYGYDREVKIVPNGVDVRKFKIQNAKVSTIGGSASGGKMTDQDSKFTIITTSRLVYKNGIDILIKSLAELRTKKLQATSYKLVIVGSGPEEKKLKSLARDLGVEELIEFAGEVPADNIPKHLSEADIFVRPSRSEGLGTAFLEAMAVGLPVVGTPVGGIPDFLQDEVTGLVCRPDDPKDLAKKIQSLVQDEVLRKKLGQNGRKLVEQRYSWDNIAASMEAIFQKL